jgi:hypothetical protein
MNNPINLFTNLSSYNASESLRKLQEQDTKKDDLDVAQEANAQAKAQPNLDDLDVYDLDIQINQEKTPHITRERTEGACTYTCYVAVCSDGCHYTTTVRCTD